MFGFIKKLFGTAQTRLISSYAKIVKDVNQWETSFQSLSDDALRHKTEEFRQRIAKGETTDSLLPEAYATVKAACRRLCGTEVHVSGYNQKWDMVPFDVQIIGAIGMHYGAVAEMHTGEGKTLTAVMPLYLNALTGKPVHLVTVNDYLAQRDCEWVGAVLRWLGITTAVLTNDVPMEERPAVYAANVVYGTASEFGFDYLRDNSMASHKRDQVQRGYYFAIIDEVDSILIDEARTPLIISGPVSVSRQLYDQIKDGVGSLVRKQRDLCNRLATEARKVLEKETTDSSKAATKQTEALEHEALRKLWLVNKGTPQNKILKRFKEDPDLRAALDKMELYYYSDQNKEEKNQQLALLYILIDEKNNEFELTDKGIAAWEECGGKSDDFIMLDISHEYLLIDQNPNLSDEEKLQKRLDVQEEDAKRKERAHNLRQLLRAHLLMEKDIDYIVHDDKIIIIDENTGRPQPGRRFADGLHQAIEAKEGVSIQKETQTYATITLQNYFRMYNKLAGMTGTAMTEANEFKQTYKMEVLEIPTHRPRRRVDANDEVYMSEREKYNAILKAVKEVHAKGRPILIGTESVEVSEKLSRIFKQHGLEHTVLNAKQNDREAEIISQAGHRGAITIATNMAGRGTDIKLEPGVADLGGLHVVGTTRHQSRRIDRQLRGRSARQGDPGSSQFYICFEDSLLRLFASPRITSLLQKMRPPEGEPISAGILNRSIETAQKRLEQRNYTMRKHTLEYDDVMNKQRQEIYGFRNELLHTDEVEEMAREILETVCSQAGDKFFQSRSSETGWDPEGYRQWLMQHLPISFEDGVFDQEYLELPEIEQIAINKVLEEFRAKLEREYAKFAPSEASGKGPHPVHEAMRNLMIRKLDHLWQEHLLSMDHLRADVNLRSFGQKDPLTEFKHESFRLFHELSEQLRTEIAQDLFRFEFATPDHTVMQQLMAKLQMETNRSLFSDLVTQVPPAAEPAAAVEPKGKEEPILAGPRVGRNDVCPCGSGKKYKKCCSTGQDEQEDT